MCADELQALKDGHNNWPIVHAVSAASPNARRWGLTASVYNNKWEDVRIPAAWVTGDDKFLSSSEDLIRSDVVRAVYGENTPVFYFKTAVPIELMPQLVTKLLFVPYLDPVEVVMDMHVCGNSVLLGDALANMYPETLLKAEVRDPCVPQVQKRRSNDLADTVTSEATAWAEQHEVVGLRPVGKLCITRLQLVTSETIEQHAFAVPCMPCVLGSASAPKPPFTMPQLLCQDNLPSCLATCIFPPCVFSGDQVVAIAQHGDMTIESARGYLGSSSSYVCTKARFVAWHVSLVHPDRPAIVVYSSLVFMSHFMAALKQSGDRQLYIYAEAA